MADNTEVSNTLTKDQEKAILALLNTKTVKEASIESGVSETSIYRWLKQETFKKALKEARAEMFEHAFTRLQKGVNEAIQTLEDIHKNKEAPATARVTAARTVIETAIKVRDQEDILSRLEELEEKILNDRRV